MASCPPTSTSTWPSTYWLLVGLTQWRVLNTGRTVDDSYVEATSKLIIQALPLCVGAGESIMRRLQ